MWFLYSVMTTHNIIPLISGCLLRLLSYCSVFFEWLNTLLKSRESGCVSSFKLSHWWWFQSSKIWHNVGRYVVADISRSLLLPSSGYFKKNKPGRRSGYQEHKGDGQVRRREWRDSSSCSAWNYTELRRNEEKGIFGACGRWRCVKEIWAGEGSAKMGKN